MHTYIYTPNYSIRKGSKIKIVRLFQPFGAKNAQLGTVAQKFYLKIRRDFRKYFLWALRL